MKVAAAPQRQVQLHLVAGGGMHVVAKDARDRVGAGAASPRNAVDRRGRDAVAFRVLQVDADRAVEEVVLLIDAADGRELVAQPLAASGRTSFGRKPQRSIPGTSRAVAAGRRAGAMPPLHVQEAVVRAVVGVDVVVVAVAVVVDRRRPRVQHVAVRRGAHVVGVRVQVPLSFVRSAAAHPGDERVGAGCVCRRVGRPPGEDRVPDAEGQRGLAQAQWSADKAQHPPCRWR